MTDDESLYDPADDIRYIADLIESGLEDLHEACDEIVSAGKLSGARARSIVRQLNEICNELEDAINAPQ